MTPRALLEVRGVSKRFDSGPALSDATLAVAQGEILGILGPSGAGKSTLLRILALLEVPSNGEVVFEGKPASARNDVSLAARRRMAVVLQKPTVFRDTVLHNVMYGLRVRGVARGESETRAAAALDAVGLGAKGTRPARTLSGGEMQRMAFARAWVTSPAILFLDEFTANLDPATVELLEGRVREYRKGGGTVVMVTHNLPQGRRLADRVALLLTGRLVEAGPAAPFFDGPQSSDARDFLSGKMVW